MPNTRPRIIFDKNNICNACQNSKNKKKINWKSRKKEFDKIIEDIELKRKKK